MVTGEGCGVADGVGRCWLKLAGLAKGGRLGPCDALAWRARSRGRRRLDGE